LNAVILSNPANPVSLVVWPGVEAIERFDPQSNDEKGV
jgi:hypothetical protein